MRHFELVIPAYNEEKNLSLLLERVVSSAKEFGQTPESFNLVLVENGSSDNSFDVMQELLVKNNWIEWIRVVRVIKNQGYGFGIMSGLKETKAEIVGWSHADLQADPRNAFIALKLLEGQKDKRVLVKGERLGRNWKDKMVSRVFECLARLILGLKVYEMNAQPKVFSRDLLNRLVNPPKTFALDLYLLFHAQKNGYEVMTFNVFFPPRIHGASKWASHFASRYKTILGMIKYMFELFSREGRA